MHGRTPSKYAHVVEQLDLTAAGMVNGCPLHLNGSARVGRRELTIELETPALPLDWDAASLLAGPLDVLLIAQLVEQTDDQLPLIAASRADVFAEGNRWFGTQRAQARLAGNRCNLQIEGDIRLEVGERITTLAPWTLHRHGHESAGACTFVANHRVQTSRGRDVAIVTTTRLEAAIAVNGATLTFAADLLCSKANDRTRMGAIRRY